MQIYNTLTRKKEEFIPRNGKEVKMFVCGPTVYDYSHIGHARTYIFYDVLAKYLRYKGYDVFYLQNITDIDDKIINRANQSGKDPLELAREFTEAHHDDMKALGIDSVDKYAPATEYIPQIISQVKKLIEKGFAYKIENDGYYFDLTKFPEYGKLSGRTVEGAEDAVSRIDESINKRNKGDFCLWKFSKEGEPSWDYKTGKYLGISDGGPAFVKTSAGKPGWHIEDTAITESEFGPQYDIHGGALELMFPHHEAEIAQMEAISGKVPMVKYWIHSGVLIVGGKKMSKSLGNFITIKDILKKYPKETLRFLALSNHYRSPLDYSEELLNANINAVKGISEFLTYKKFWKEKIPAKGETDKLDSLTNGIIKELDNDFNVPVAIGKFFDLIKAAEPILKEGYSSKSLDESIEFMDKIVGIIPKIPEIPENIKKLSDEREKIRQSGDFKKADELRQEIINLDYEVDDTPFGSLIKKI